MAATTGRRRPSPALVPPQVAIQQADYAAWNVWSSLNGQPLLPFRYQHLGDMMALGSEAAAVTFPLGGGVTLEGPAGGLLRRAAYAYRQPTWDLRLRVGGALVQSVAEQAAALAERALSDLAPP